MKCLTCVVHCQAPTEWFHKLIFAKSFEMDENVSVFSQQKLYLSYKFKNIPLLRVTILKPCSVCSMCTKTLIAIVYVGYSQNSVRIC